MSSSERSKEEETPRTPQSAESFTTNSDLEKKVDLPEIAQKETTDQDNNVSPLKSSSADIPNQETVFKTPDPRLITQDPVKPTKVSLDSGEEVEGGEWELLTGKILNWWEQKNISSQIGKLTQALVIGAGVFGLVVILKIYGRLLGAISQIPLAPNLLELAGIIWVMCFVSTKLVRAKDRNEFIAGVVDRWQKLLGTQEKGN